MTPQNNFDALDRYLSEIGRTPLLTPTQETKLAKKIRRGDEKARSLMVTSNLRLVVTIARSYANLGLPLLDLISEGNIGLVKAVNRFDPAKGAKLSSYATWWIRQAIKRALDNQSRMIRVPVHHREKHMKVRQVASRLTQELGREPTDEELGAEIGIDADKVSKLNATATVPISIDALNARMGDEGITGFAESVADEETETPFESLRDRDLREKVSDLLSVLSAREKKIVFQRFGFDGGRRHTLEEIGAGIGLTRERIRQLQLGAISKMRRALSDIEDPSNIPLPMAA